MPIYHVLRREYDSTWRETYFSELARFEATDDEANTKFHEIKNRNPELECVLVPDDQYTRIIRNNGQFCL